VPRGLGNNLVAGFIGGPRSRPFAGCSIILMLGPRCARNPQPERDPRPYHATICAYVNPATRFCDAERSAPSIQAACPTGFSFFDRPLPLDRTGRFYVASRALERAGRDEVFFRWQPRDIFRRANWIPVSHRAEEEAVLSATQSPVAREVFRSLCGAKQRGNGLDKLRIVAPRSDPLPASGGGEDSSSPALPGGPPSRCAQASGNSCIGELSWFFGFCIEERLGLRCGGLSIAPMWRRSKRHKSDQIVKLHERESDQWRGGDAHIAYASSRQILEAVIAFSLLPNERRSQIRLIRETAARYLPSGLVAGGDVAAARSISLSAG